MIKRTTYLNRISPFIDKDIIADCKIKLNTLEK